MASSCSFVAFPLKCLIYGNTGLSISISSGVGLSEKFEQLESPSSVSDLNNFTRLDEHFIFFSRYEFSGNHELHFVSRISHFISSFHKQCVSQFPPPLDCDWYLKSIQQDTDAEATLGYREGFS